MFSIFWRFFPGPAWLRIILMLALLAAVVYVLITYVYPYVATVVTPPESTVEGMSVGYPAQ